MRLLPMVRESEHYRDGNCPYHRYRGIVVDADKAYDLIEMCGHQHRTEEAARSCAILLVNRIERTWKRERSR